MRLTRVLASVLVVVFGAASGFANTVKNSDYGQTAPQGSETLTVSGSAAYNTQVGCPFPDKPCSSGQTLYVVQFTDLSGSGNVQFSGFSGFTQMTMMTDILSGEVFAVPNTAQNGADCTDGRATPSDILGTSGATFSTCFSFSVPAGLTLGNPSLDATDGTVTLSFSGATTDEDLTFYVFDSVGGPAVTATLNQGVSSVPEPSTVALLVTGIAGASIKRFRRIIPKSE